MTQTSVLELKADTFSFPVLQLLDNDMDAVATELGQKTEKTPELFQNTPVVIDLHRLASTQASVDFPLLVGLMRGYSMIPIGVRGGNTHQNEMAEMMELAILSESDGQVSAPSTHRAPKAGKPVQKTGQTKKNSLPNANRFVTRPVRSGQRLYAPGGDLIVIGPINSGAEVVADGNIHVYGTLRGRAHAGVKGNREAHIFCRDLRAELISIAGRYRVNLATDPALCGKPVHVYLKDQSLAVDEL